MKVFISWSGEQSRKVGEELVKWLPRVLQAVKPWFSPKDLAKGKPWADSLLAELATVKIGIFCLTPSNVEAPWIAFEASACMAKAEGRAFTFLHGVDYSEVKGPLSIFNHSKTDREGTFLMVENINKVLPEPLADDVLKDVFNDGWPKLEAALKAIPAVAPGAAKPPERSNEDMLKEVLGIVRALPEQVARAAKSRGLFEHLALASMGRGLSPAHGVVPGLLAGSSERRADHVTISKNLERFGVASDLAEAIAVAALTGKHDESRVNGYTLAKAQSTAAMSGAPAALIAALESLSLWLSMESDPQASLFA